VEIFIYISEDRGTCLATYVGDKLSSRLRAEQDELPVFYLQYRPYRSPANMRPDWWHKLKLGEEIGLNTHDVIVPIGIGKRGDFEPSLYERVVPQKYH